MAAAGSEAAALRGAVAALLRERGAQQVLLEALADGDAELQLALAESMALVTGHFEEFAGLLGGVHDGVRDLQRAAVEQQAENQTQAEHRSRVREALDEIQPGLQDISRPAGETGVVYNTLPPDTAAFTGRRAEIGEIVTQVARAAAHAGVVSIHAINGMPRSGQERPRRAHRPLVGRPVPGPATVRRPARAHRQQGAGRPGRDPRGVVDRGRIGSAAASHRPGRTRSTLARPDGRATGATGVGQRCQQRPDLAAAAGRQGQFGAGHQPPASRRPALCGHRSPHGRLASRGRGGDVPAPRPADGGRGDGPSGRNGSRWHHTCSPPAREWSGLADGRGLHATLLPTCAEMAPKALPRSVCRTAAPRLCGDGPNMQIRIAFRCMCSPRLRGDGPPVRGVDPLRCLCCPPAQG